MKVAPSHTPPSPPFPVPFWVGTVLRPPPRKEGAEGGVLRELGREAGAAIQGWGCSPRPDCGRNRHRTGLLQTTARPSS